MDQRGISHAPGVGGVVLAGGQSRRMGQDKALIRLSTGETFLQKAFHLLASLLTPCFVSHAKGRPYAGFPPLEDGRENCGPLAGLTAALELAHSLDLTAMLVIPCDLPLLTAPILKNLLAAHARAPAKTLASMWQNGASGKLEPLLAVYSVTALPFFHGALDRGDLALRHLLPVTRVCRLPYGPELAPIFLNCNRPEDLETIDSQIRPK